MENSRHERAIVVAASYIIGFTSAFIAYGLNGTEPTLNTGIAVSVAQDSARELSEPVRKHDALVRIESDGLVVVTKDRERLLSARKSSPFVASAISAGPHPGYAERIIEAELSRNGDFVYFCEQLTTDAETCDAYVYSVDADTLHQVTIDNESYHPEIVSHSSAWSPTGQLSIGDYMSVSPTTPWVLRSY